MIARHERVLVDLGTGDGRAVVRAARRDTGSLVVGVDTDAAAMREASHRAARPARKGGQPNALFLAGTLEGLPCVLDGHVTDLRVTLPWGSLLHDAATAAPAFVARLGSLLHPRGQLRLLLSITEREATTGLAGLDDAGLPVIVGGYAAHGLAVRDARPATARDVEELDSSWAKRLGIPGRRSGYLLRFGARGG